MRKILDTNAILRYLLNDIEEQASQVEEQIDNGEALTISEVICEVVYVLNGIYKLNRLDISDTISNLLDNVYIAEKTIVLKSLEIYKTSKLDYVDCILVARNKVYNDRILSFDKDLNRAINKQ